MSQTKAQLLDNIKDNVQLDARNSLRFADTDSSHYVAFKAPATVSSNVTWTLPAADGSANYVLATDGSGNLSWIADPAGQWVTSGSNIYFTGGNVGIGDTSPSNPLSVTGASAFNGDVTFTGASYNVTWDKSADDLIFNDNAKAAFGTSSDLTLYHDGSQSIINDTANRLQIRSDHIELMTAAGKNEYYLQATEDGAVELYYDNVLKFATSADGTSLTGNATVAGTVAPSANATYNLGYNSQRWNDIYMKNDMFINDDGRICWGDGNDLQIYHDGSHSHIKDSGTGILSVNTNQFQLTNAADTEVIINAVENGNVALYYDNSKKFETTSAGTTTTGNHVVVGLVACDGLLADDNEKIKLGSGEDLEIYHDGSNSIIKNTTGVLAFLCADIQLANAAGNEQMIRAYADGAVELYHNNSKKFQTESYGLQVFGNLFIADGGSGSGENRIDIGNGSDLKIFHDGTDSQIVNTTGKLRFKSDAHFWFTKNNGSNALYIDPDGVTILYNNSTAKLETSGSGITVYGSVTETSDVALKKEITPLSDSLTKVKQLNGYSYKFKDTDIASIGFTAQDVEKVYPDLVEGEEGKKGLNYSGLIAPLLEAVKELSTKIETLETKVAALESA